MLIYIQTFHTIIFDRNLHKSIQYVGFSYNYDLSYLCKNKRQLLQFPFLENIVEGRLKKKLLQSPSPNRVVFV